VQQSCCTPAKQENKICAHAREEYNKNMMKIIMIGPGGLLLVVSYLFAVPQFQFFGWGCRRKSK